MEGIPLVGEQAEQGLAQPMPRHEASLLSPLRYPGGKRRLVGYIAQALQMNGLRPKLYVEPFAGGASVAIQLLNDGHVERIALGERDPLIASFWETVFFDHAWLIWQIEKIEPTLELWQHMRESQPRSKREQALKCLVLNRTSFSGILNEHAGPIGGKAQRSAHTIDCRFARAAVIKRIEQIAQLADRVLFVRQGDWSILVNQTLATDYRSDEIFFYFDPPFYAKAERLYRYSFDAAEHQRLHDCLAHLHASYILSYDAAQPIIDLYENSGIGPRRVELLYSAKRIAARVQAQEIIISNLPHLPEPSRLWLTTEEWKRKTLEQPVTRGEM